MVSVETRRSHFTWLVFFSPSPDVFDLSLTDSCLQEGEETTTENGINPELAKVGSKNSPPFVALQRRASSIMWFRNAGKSW